MGRVEWDGNIHNEKTRRGYDVMRVSQGGNVRIVYRKDMLQGKYALEIKMINEYGDSWWTTAQGWISSDSISDVENASKNMADEPIRV